MSSIPPGRMRLPNLCRIGDEWIAESCKHPGFRLVMKAKVMVVGLWYTHESLVGRDGQWVKVDVEHTAVLVEGAWHQLERADADR